MWESLPMKPLGLGSVAWGLGFRVCGLGFGGVGSLVSGSVLVQARP